MGCLPTVLRLAWTYVGNVLLLLCTVLIARGTAPYLTDALLIGVAGGLIAARYFDISRCGGLTADGEPATLLDWRRYARGVTVVVLILWVFARFAAARGWWTAAVL